MGKKYYSKVIVKNTTKDELRYKGEWIGSDAVWIIRPPVSIPAGGMASFELQSSKRAGVYYEAIGGIEYHLSFTCPKRGTNSAEGSAFTGLQKYKSKGSKVGFTFHIGEPSKACWNKHDDYDGKLTCDQTPVKKVQSNWMLTLNSATKSFGQMKLHEVFWPGTHDSGCWKMDNALKRPVSKTQSQTFLNQLKGGIRYFDLRLKWKAKDKFQFRHGSATSKAYLSDLFDDLSNFYSNPLHSQEVVILDFTHFQDFDTKEKEKDLINTILKSKIKNHLAGKRKGECKLKDIWDEGKNIILSTSFRAKENLIWNGVSLFASGWSGTTFWPDKNSVSSMNKFLNEKLNENYNDKLWVLQNILTPNGWDWGAGGLGKLAKSANRSLYKSLNDIKKWRTKSNIVIIDFNRQDGGGTLDNQLAVYAQIINYNRILK